MFQFWGCGCKDIQQMQKDIPRKKFLETVGFVLPAKTTVGLIVYRTVVFAGRTKLRVFENFFWGYLFAFVECLCNRSPKIDQKLQFNFNYCKPSELAG